MEPAKLTNAVGVPISLSVCRTVLRSLACLSMLHPWVATMQYKKMQDVVDSAFEEIRSNNTIMDINEVRK